MGTRLVLLLTAWWASLHVRCVESQVAEMAGEVTVVGIFEVQNPKDGQCGDVDVSSVMTAEAIKWYFRQLNNNGFPITIGFRGHKTCRLPGEAGEVAIAVANEVISSGNHGNRIVGVIGPQYSSEAESVSETLTSGRTDSRLLQIGFSTTAARLGDRQRYSNFFRVIPNDELQVEVMVSTMQQLEWNRIGIVFEDDVYGRGGAEALKSRSEMAGICVPVMRSVTISSSGDVGIDELQTILDTLIIKTSPSIKGVVFFGSRTTANTLMLALNSLSITDYPVFILSEAVQLQDGVLRSAGTVINKARGSYVVTPPKIHVAEFETYWKGLFKNAATLQTEAASNPWLLDVFRSVKACTGNCSIESLTDDDVKEAFPTQPVYVRYAILAAHTMARAIQTVHKQLCLHTTGPCPNFVDHFRPNMMIEAMENMSIDLANDFAFSLASGGNNLYSFSESVEMGIPRGAPQYEVYNYRSSADGTVAFRFHQIGSYTDGSMELNLLAIIDYKGSDTLVWPDIRKGQCSAGGLCDDCIPEDIANDVLYYPGDFYVIGLVPVYNKDTFYTCGALRVHHGYQLSEAMRFAVNKFNDDQDVFSHHFPGKTLGLIVLNTCNNAVWIQAKILRLHKHGLQLRSGEVLKVSDKILGYVGGLGSSVSIGISQVLSGLNMVTISYASTSPALSDREAHPTFMRVVTPDDKQAEAMMRIVVALKGNYIQVLYSEGSYGEGGLQAVKAAAKRHNVCIAQEIMVVESATGNYYQHYSTLRRQPDARLVIVFLRSHVTPNLMAVLKEQVTRGEFQFVGSEAWAKNPDIIDSDRDFKTLGSFTVVLEMFPVSGLLDYVRRIEPVPISENPWRSLYLEQKMGCYFPESFDKSLNHKCSASDSLSTDPSFQLDPWSVTAANAVLSLLIGSAELFKKECGAAATSLCAGFNDAQELFTAIKNNAKLDIYGDGIPTKVFDDNGDGTVGYIIYNIQKDPDDPQKLVYKNVGRYPLTGEFALYEDKIVYPADETLVSTCVDPRACEACSLTNDTTPPTVTDTETSESNSTGMIALGVIVAVLAIAVVVLAILLIRKPRAAEDPTYLTPAPEHFDAIQERPDAIGHSHTPPGSWEVPKEMSLF